MKAMIVIDIEDKAFEYYSKQNPKALTVNLMDHVGERRGFYRPKFLSLKPMPQKKGITLDMVWNSKYESQASYYSGYNACLDEILGEEDET